MFARLIFAAVNFAARNGLTESRDESKSTTKELARTTGIRGETFAYWYLRRQGYTLVARNYTVPGIKGEIDLIGYDGRALAFVEVKTRSTHKHKPLPKTPSTPTSAATSPAWHASFCVRAASIPPVAVSTCSPSNPTPVKSQSSACTNPRSAWPPSYHTNTADSQASRTPQKWHTVCFKLVWPLTSRSKIAAT